MTSTPPRLEQAMALAESIIGKCSCFAAFKDRGITDPDCSWCKYGDDVADLAQRCKELEALVPAAYSEGYKQAYDDARSHGHSPMAAWQTSAARRALSGAREEKGGEGVGD